MNETLDRIIKQSGEMWAETADRTKTPVLLATDISRSATVYELTLPKNEGHPFWQISERVLAAEEYAELMVAFDKGIRSIGSIYPVHPGPTYYIATYYVRDGRVPGWNVTGRPVRVTIEELDS